MYVRMTAGRDRGEVKDFSFEDAQAMLRNGQALPVNFDEPDPLAKRSDFEIRDAQAQISPPQISQPQIRHPQVGPLSAKVRKK